MQDPAGTPREASMRHAPRESLDHADVQAGSNEQAALAVTRPAAARAVTPGWRAWLAFASVCLFWGTSGPLIRFTVRSVAPAMLVPLRFFIAGSLLYVGLAIAGRRPRSAQLWRALPLGTALAATNVLITFGFERIEAGVGSLLLGTTALAFAVVDVCWPGGATRPSLAVWGGLLSGFLGIAALSFEPQLLAASKWQGMAMLILSTWTWAIGSVAQARMRSHADALSSSAWQMLIASVLASPMFWLDPALHLRAIGVEGWISIGALIVTASLIGFVSFVYMMQHLPAYVAGSYTYLNALVAAVLSVIWLHERLSTRFYVAAVLVLGGVALIQRGPRRKPAHAASA
jgi:drug/metabolite transporter (DMT)-like permease